MTSFSDDIVALIVAAGAGVFAGSTRDLFISTKSQVPEKGGPYTTITDTNGSGDDYIQNQDEPDEEHPTAQLRVRDPNYQIAMAKAMQLRALLVKVHNTTVGTTFYLKIRGLGNIGDGGLDDSERAQVIFNIMGDRQPA